MTLNDIKQELKVIALDNMYINRIRQEINSMISEIEDIKKNSTGALKDLTAQRCKTLLSRIQTKELIIKDIEETNNAKKNIIARLDQPQRLVMQQHYLNGLSYDDIAEELSYSTPRIFQFHRKGLEQYLQIKTNLFELSK